MIKNDKDKPTVKKTAKPASTQTNSNKKLSNTENTHKLDAADNTLTASNTTKEKQKNHEQNTPNRFHKKKKVIQPHVFSTDYEPLDLLKSKKLKIQELVELCKKYDIDQIDGLAKDEILLKIINVSSERNTPIISTGVLEILPDGYGFIRISNYLPSSDDIYISQAQIRRLGLASGDKIKGYIRKPKEGERYFSLISIEEVNNLKPEHIRLRSNFSQLTPIYPDEQLRLETGPTPVAGRIIDMLSPIGKGQRSLVVSPPKAGKTSILKEIANSISINHPEVMIKVLLIDERPEEVTDMERSVNGEVISSTFDEPPEQHVRISELVLESAKRLVECGKDVVILLDSITRLARAYNLVVPPSGRTLSGGLDPSSLHKPKRFFGGARNIESGGSLTIISTALVDTGSRMDDIIYEEFKGTGNMELHLERRLANRRIYPAIDIINSGTRKEELLISGEILKKTYLLRKNIDSESATEELIKLLAQTKNNGEFLNSPIFA